MATNDVDLQVINSMTQDKMDSLKDADGKIPSLANQLIMTYEDDADSSQLRAEVVYDKASPDISKNWELIGGIAKGRTVSGKDFTKYKSLIVYMGDASNPNDYQVNVIIKIDGVANTGSYGSSVVGWNNANYMIFVNSEKTSITNNSDYTSIIIKIVGVYQYENSN